MSLEGAGSGGWAAKGSSSARRVDHRSEGDRGPAPTRPRPHRCASRRGPQRGSGGAIQAGACTNGLNRTHRAAQSSESGGRALRAQRAMEKWTGRWRALASPVDNACALPTAVTFAHMRFASSISGRFRPTSGPHLVGKDCYSTIHGKSGTFSVAAFGGASLKPPPLPLALRRTEDGRAYRRHA